MFARLFVRSSVGARYLFGRYPLRVTVRRYGLFEDMEIEVSKKMRGDCVFRFDLMDDPGVDLDHAAQRQFESFLRERPASASNSPASILSRVAS